MEDDETGPEEAYVQSPMLTRAHCPNDQTTTIEIALGRLLCGWRVAEVQE